MAPAMYSEEKLLVDLEDYVLDVDPDFTLVGNSHIELLSSILAQPSQHNILYAGPSGVGKTATIHGMAHRKQLAVADPEKATETGLPLHMVDRRFLLLDVNALFDRNDTSVIGRDIHLIFAELEKPGHHVLVIEDGNDLLRGIQDHQVYGLISSLMKELKRGRFQTIWMIREEPGRNKLAEVLDCHSDVRELFTVVEKAEPARDEIHAILAARKHRLEAHFEGLAITDAAIEEIVSLTTQYPALKLWTRQQPSCSITLLERIASTYVSRGQTRPPELREREARLASVVAQLNGSEAGEKDGAAALKAEKIELERQIGDYEAKWKQQAQQLYKVQALMREHQTKLTIAERKLDEHMEALRRKLWDEKSDGSEPSPREIEIAKTEEIRQVEEDLRKINHNLTRIVDTARQLKSEVNTQLTLDTVDVQAIFSEISGIPVADLDEDEADKILHLDQTIKEKVYGQDESVDIVAGTIKAARVGLKGAKGTMGVFICLGSSGVGKSYMAEVVAEALFGAKDAMTPFDMSEYMEKHTVSQLKGAPPGYAGYGEGGRLTNAVREKPYQAVLLDEVEKAHPDVFKILLQVFNDGRLSDELGTVRFNKTVFFLTTNIGQELALSGKIDPATAAGRQAIIQELKVFFPQEFLNRVDEFLLFNPLGPAHVCQIVRRDLKELNRNEGLLQKAMTVHLPDDDIQRLVDDKYRVEEGARQVQKFIENRMNPHLVPILLKHEGQKGGVIQARYSPDINGFTVDFSPPE
ncbi:MAG: hypothetical protein ETSY2_13360 [Candidatus Entotheonella gemina]|uniref:AAA+ ATPase domain-containing protein n=1 Tax=Candidatus Entotheonella gemina TaxID=1429439 RepID=W4MA38_9BACT|nr:MAG: hypothetical protein ETSY2_13360 [Candidatus Entotheonella gemina]